MTSPPPAKKPSGFSLYGDLLDPSKPAVITGAPVKYAMKTSPPPENSAAAAKKKDASLKFQPVKRAPQAAQGKGKGSGKAGWGSSSSVAGHKTSSSVVSAGVEEPQRARFEDWVGDEEEEVFFDHRPKIPRGGKKRKGRKGGASGEEVEVDWDRIYDPARPTNLAAYRGSTEQEAERREWKEFLYWHAARARQKWERREGKRDTRAPTGKMSFAPPRSLNLAPPAIDSSDRVSGEPMEVDYDDEYQPSLNVSAVDSVPTHGQEATSSEDTCARRLRSSGVTATTDVPLTRAPPAPIISHASLPPAVARSQAPADVATKLAAAKAKLEAAKAKHEAERAQAVGIVGAANSQTLPARVSPPPPPPPPEDHDGTSITRAPVLYNQEQIVQASAAPQSSDIPRSKAPGQKGFGARMMAKMGWEKGQGLGAHGEGITTALVAQAEKRKKRSDAAGGGWAQPRNMGKIVGGKKRAVNSTADDDGAFGTMSYVIRLTGMLEGLDVEYEIAENNLMQEIGEEFGEKYGTIERVYVWKESSGGQNDVFVKFTSQLSALRAVNATDGMTFADNAVVARFFDDGKFEAGDYA